MSEYWKGGGIAVYDLDECFTAIKQRNEDNESRIEYLEEENKRLKDDHYKDEEAAKMKDILNWMKADYRRGFPISESEKKTIDNWCKKHDEEKHGLNTLEKKLRAGGCIGGRYHYKFTPTSIGTCGEIVCSCGESFEFQEL